LNIVLCCSSCHQSHHAGVLTISGTAEHLEVRRPVQPRASVNMHDHADAIDTDLRSQVGETDHQVAVPAADVAAAADGGAAIARRNAHVGAAGKLAPTNGHVDVAGISKLNAAILRTEAKAALTGLGWKPAVARAAVTAAVAQGADTTLERLVFESLRRCPTPKA
jgi:hypothetical protein